MRTMITHPLLLTLSAAVALLTGCASTGYEKGEKTAATIQSAADQISALPGHIDKSLASLNDLVTNPQTDLRPQFKQFASNLDTLESAAKDIGELRSKMGENGKAFFARWDEQLAAIQNEDIKARSQSRKDDVTRKLQSVKLSYSEAALAFKPFLSDLKDVRTALSADLTQGGAGAVKGPAVKATSAAGPLKDSITKVADAFKALGLAMSSATPQNR